MASVWRKAMLYLGLGPDDEYDDYTPVEDPSHLQPHGQAPQRYVPPDPPEPQMSAVRPLAREVEQPSGVTTVPRRSSVVKPLVAQGPSPKPYALSPTSFNEAQDIADKFMAGVPVIVNLQGVDRDLSRRLVDFASGLCYGMRGQMERVTHQLYLLTPAHVEVSPEEKRRLRESD
ncbi:MAG: cell division inhibitor SepF [Actinomycetota bacterium]|jgi:cell division inhibitor SepF|nr:cell division inhibitor SepF [Actinomycetota bacterium]